MPILSPDWVVRLKTLDYSNIHTRGTMVNLEQLDREIAELKANSDEAVRIRACYLSEIDKNNKRLRELMATREQLDACQGCSNLNGNVYDWIRTLATDVREMKMEIEKLKALKCPIHDSQRRLDGIWRFLIQIKPGRIGWHRVKAESMNIRHSFGIAFWDGDSFSSERWDDNQEWCITHWIDHDAV